MQAQCLKQGKKVINAKEESDQNNIKNRHNTLAEEDNAEEIIA